MLYSISRTAITAVQCTELEEQYWQNSYVAIHDENGKSKKTPQLVVCLLYGSLYSVQCIVLEEQLYLVLQY